MREGIVMISEFLAGSGYVPSDGSGYKSFVYGFIFLIVIMIFKCISNMKVFSKYKKGRAFVKRCTKKTSAKVLSTSIRYEVLERDKTYNSKKVIIEIYDIYEYKINDKVYKKECLVPRAYILFGEDIFNTSMYNYLCGDDLLDGDNEIKKIGSKVEICYNPKNVEEFYCVGDEYYINIISDEANKCYSKFALLIFALILLVIIAL